MSELNLFEQATRQRLRFSSPKGELTVEQLWDLPLTSTKGVSLDELAIAANRQLREQAEDSFVESKSNPLKAQLQLQLDLLKHIISVRQAENEERRQASENAAKAARLREILAERGVKQLENLSDEEIRKQLEELKG